MVSPCMAAAERGAIDPLQGERLVDHQLLRVVAALHLDHVAGRGARRWRPRCDSPGRTVPFGRAGHTVASKSGRPARRNTMRQRRSTAIARTAVLQAIEDAEPFISRNSAAADQQVLEADVAQHVAHDAGAQVASPPRAFLDVGFAAHAHHQLVDAPASHQPSTMPGPILPTAPSTHTQVTSNASAMLAACSSSGCGRNLRLHGQQVIEELRQWPGHPQGGQALAVPVGAAGVRSAGDRHDGDEVAVGADRRSAARRPWSRRLRSCASGGQACVVVVQHHAVQAQQAFALVDAASVVDGLRAAADRAGGAAVAFLLALEPEPAEGGRDRQRARRAGTGTCRTAVR